MGEDNNNDRCGFSWLIGGDDDPHPVSCRLPEGHAGHHRAGVFTELKYTETTFSEGVMADAPVCATCGGAGRVSCDDMGSEDMPCPACGKKAHPGATRPEPAPPPGERPGLPVAHRLVIADLEAREAHGRAKYGAPLQPRNGRDAMVDAYQEALDLVAYLRQAIWERDNPARPRVNLNLGDGDRPYYVHRVALDDAHDAAIVAAAEAMEAYISRALAGEATSLRGLIDEVKALGGTHPYTTGKREAPARPDLADRLAALVATSAVETVDGAFAWLAHRGSRPAEASPEELRAWAREYLDEKTEKKRGEHP